MTDKTEKQAAPEYASKSAHDKLVARVRNLEAHVDHIVSTIGANISVDVAMPEQDGEGS